MTKRTRQLHNGHPRKKQRQAPVEPEVAAELPTPESYDDPDSGFFEDDNIDTHPRTFDHHHVEKLQEFTNDLHQALQGSLPLRTCPYTAVYVLLLRWDEDDLGVQSEISRLRRVFEDQFCFEVEEWNIPTLDPYHSLQDKIYHLQKCHQSPSDLLIFYYGGHSDPDTRRGRSIWHANRLATTPSLEWFNIQPMLLTAKPHVLMILDCCFAANAARDTTEGSSKELLAACGRENQTLGVGTHSFTSVLIEELQNFEGAAFTIAMLHARLITLRHKLAYTPIYAALAEKGGNSIVISPLPRNPSPSPQGSDCSTGPGFNASTAVVTSAQEQVNTANDAPTALPTPVSLAGSTRVLLAVSVAEDVAHNVAQWVSWLTTAAPWDVSRVDVRLECMYKSHSTLLLVSVPIVGWSRLPESAAYRFIGFIKSGNLICEKANPGPIAETILHPITPNDVSGESSADSRTKEHTFTNAHHGDPYSPVITKSVAPQRTSMPNQPVSSSGPGADRQASQSWPREKDELLMRARQQGLNWQPIAAKYFPNKTANACRKRHERLMEKRDQPVWERDKMDTVAKAYNDVREQVWKKLADRVGEKWQTVEAKCMEQGLKSLHEIARAASRPSRISATINDSDDEKTLTPYPLLGRASLHHEAAQGMSSGVRFGSDRHIGELAPFQLPKLPNFSNMFASPSDLCKAPSPYNQASAITTH